MQHRVGGAAERHHRHHRVLKGRTGHDIQGLEVHLEQVQHCSTSQPAFVHFQRILRGHRAAVWETHPKSLNGGGHGVCGVHAAARTGTGARVAHGVHASRLVGLSSHKLTVALEGGYDVQRFTRCGIPRLDSAPVDHHRGSVQAGHSHQRAGHVLIASGERDIPVVPLSTHHRLNTVRNDVTRLKTEAHPVGAHGDAVADPDGVEAHAHHAGFDDALFHFQREIHKMHVARVALVPHGGDANLCPVHVLFIHPCRVQHRL
mmetsp:Transcript_26694/g.44768  ORF Transcript_26694/g.44768 Transcript_26694/m.44768 type:complete len:260 (-) Transcript_26694:316-1095(-)